MGVALAKILDDAAIVILHQDLGQHDPPVPREVTNRCFTLRKSQGELLWQLQASQYSVWSSKPLSEYPHHTLFLAPHVLLRI
jgi:hypothetical protein